MLSVPWIHIQLPQQPRRPIRAEMVLTGYYLRVYHQPTLNMTLISLRILAGCPVLPIPLSSDRMVIAVLEQTRQLIRLFLRRFRPLPVWRAPGRLQAIRLHGETIPASRTQLDQQRAFGSL